MRTSLPTLLVEKCAQTIESVVIPALADAPAAEQAALTAELLRTLATTIEEKGEELLQENLALEGVFRKARSALAQQSLSANADAVRLMNVLDPALQNTGSLHTSISEENDRLKGVMVLLIRGIDTVADDLPAGTASALRESIHTALTQLVSNAVARVTGTRPGEGR